MSDGARELSLAEYVIALGNSDHRAANEYCDMVRRITELEADKAKLVKFANGVLEMVGESYTDPDGYEVTVRAGENGLIKAVTVTEPCGEYCACADCGFPTQCLRPTDLIKEQG